VKRKHASSEGGEVEFKIMRFNPEDDQGSHWQSFYVPWERLDRVLDGLHHIKWYLDGSLTFRRSCAHGICGSDAMLINGVNRLACKVLIKDLKGPITVEPIRGLTVEKDLVVDMEPFFAAYKKMLPFLINDDPEPSRERLQSPEERERFDDTTKCILCAACTTSCPVFWHNGEYVGPAAIVNAHRFVFDSRDTGGKQRLEILNQMDGAFACRTTFNCTEACPRGIHVTRAINEVKQAMLYEKV
jgi:succinate dehydrogenase / fumarate reductase iron-sulfur subunit